MSDEDTQFNATLPIVTVDFSEYDPQKNYLLITIGNHVLSPTGEGVNELDSTSGRLVSQISLSRTCGVIVVPDKHNASFRGLGYPIVEYGQTVAVPLQDVEQPYSGAITFHTFCEPTSLHDTVDMGTREITGSGKFDGYNHLAGAYIPIATALHCATAGATQINLKTRNSSTCSNDQEFKVVIAGTWSSITCRDGVGGTLLPNDVRFNGDAEGSDNRPIVVGKEQIRQGFDKLMKEMSGCNGSWNTNLLEKITLHIGEGLFAPYDKQLEVEIRSFVATHGTTVQIGSDATDNDTPKSVSINQLPTHLQLGFVTANMVALTQAYPIGAPTLCGEDGAASADETEYGGLFQTCSYTLSSHFDLSPKDIHPNLGVVSVSHALYLSQTSATEAEKIVAPFARSDSRFVNCGNPRCVSCADPPEENPVVKTVPVKTASGAFEQILRGVSRNVVLSNNVRPSQRTEKCVPYTPAPNSCNAAPRKIPCTAMSTCNGSCKCKICVDTAKLIKLTQRVASSSNAFQTLTSYVSDKTVTNTDANNVPICTGNPPTLIRLNRIVPKH